MSRYIDADALIKDLKKQYMFLFGTDELPSGIQGVIENFPSSDVVSREKYDYLRELYRRLLENAGILSAAIKEYERKENDKL